MRTIGIFILSLLGLGILSVIFMVLVENNNGNWRVAIRDFLLCTLGFATFVALLGIGLYLVVTQ